MPDPCDFGCGGCGRTCDPDEPIRCFVEWGGVDPEAERVARDWVLCGGRAHATWPRPGGLEAQDAGTVFLFAAIDALVAQEEVRAVREAERSVDRAGRR